MSYTELYKSKLKTAKDAVKVIKAGDWVDYGCFIGQAFTLDIALAERKDELNDVKIRAVTRTYSTAVTKADPEGEHFTYHSWHFSAGERKMHDKGLAYFIPILFREVPQYYNNEIDVDVAMIQVTPMDSQGFFNYGLQNAFTRTIIEKAKYVILEVNENLPRVLGGYNEAVHITEIDCVVEGESPAMPDIPEAPICEIDQQIAEMIVGQLEDGSCIQLGIGGMPNAVGKLIAKSDLKDLGVHTEMFVDAYIDMYESGRITGRNKTIDKGKMVFTFGMGSNKLYDFVNNNPLIASYPVNYTNYPHIIAQNEKVISINNCVDMDIFGQVSSESSGVRQISGTGGQVDFFEGAYLSKGGKAFCCMTSTYNAKDGSLASRIKPVLSPGAIVTTPRSVVNYIVTEYGIVNMKGKSTWERAEAIISIAHPDFRESLIKDAEEFGIWRKSNKRD